MYAARNPRKRADAKVEEEEAFELDAEGRMVIEDPDDEDELKAKKKRGRKRQSTEAALDDMDDERDNTDVITSSSRKRPAGRNTNDDDEEEEAEQQPRGGRSGGGRQGGGGGGAAGQGPNKKRKKDAPQHSGERFKSGKAGGDHKKGGKVEPYAYLPLDPASLNKRTKRKAVGQWRGVVRAAQAGAKQGSAGRGKKRA